MNAVLISLVFFPLFSLIADENNCQLNNVKSFYDYVLKNNPTSTEVALKKRQAEAGIELARQRPNPLFEFDYTKSDQFGIDVNTYSVAARHIWELGSKRQKRASKAEAQKKLTDTSLALELFKSNASSVLAYQKVAQLKILSEAVDEAVRTFDKLVRKLSRRQRLNPEEAVSLSTLRLAASEYKTQLNHVENDKNVLEGDLEFFSKCKIVRPMYKELNFPQPQEILVKDQGKGLVELEDLKIEAASKEVEVQKSLAYSDIQVGPRIEYKREGDNEFLSGGISVEFALPFFHRNSGGKSKALTTLSYQRNRSKNVKTSLQIEKKNLLKKYERSLRTFKSMPSLKRLEKKHQQVESLFSRGLVSISMSIESHRQQVDFLRSRFETENDLLSTYIKLKLIDGDLSSIDRLMK